MTKYYYCEPIKGDVYRVESNSIPIEFISLDGSFEYDDTTYYLETEEWKIKFQDSLSLRVSQDQLKVYFICPIKRGKVNTKALVIDARGASYHTFVPTFPMPRLGESLFKLRMELEVVSLVPLKDLIYGVRKARKADTTLV